MIDIAEFRGYLKINKAALDDEVIQQPSLLFAVSEACAEATARRDKLKEQLATVDAELDFEIRESAVVKFTDTAIKAQIQIHKDHTVAFKNYLAAKQQADVLSALKDAFQQRSYGIRDLCQLFIANYFEESSVRGNSNTDTVAYQTRREAMAEKRATRARAQISD